MHAPKALVAGAVALLALTSPAWGAAAPPAGGSPVLALLEDLLEADGKSPGAAVGHALRAIALAEGVSVPATGACPRLADALAAEAERFGIAAPPLPALLPPKLDEALGCLLGAVHQANLAHDATFEGLRMDERLALFAAGDDPAPELVKLLEGRDHRHMLLASIAVADAVEVAVPLLRELGQSPARLTPLDLRPILRYEPTGNQLYDHNYVLIVDQEGDDTYDNNAGGVWTAFGAGRYDVTDEWMHVGQGDFDAGVGAKTQDADAALSAGLVLDLAGNDAYGVKHAPLFKDEERGCAGEDVVPWVGTIGGGIIGVGMLFDLAGTNTYTGRAQTQGAGHLLGVGVLYMGPGPDTLEAVRAAQGSGLLGGIGLLIDEDGYSSYTGYAPPLGLFNGDLSICDAGVRYVQGSSFDRRAGPLLPSIGILLDQGGHDDYVAPDGILTHGFGQGPGLGLLLDAEGDDEYASGDRAMGAAQGRSADFNEQAPWGGGLGVLRDLGGNDAYVMSTGNGQGWALSHITTEPLPPADLAEVLIWARNRNEAVGALYDSGGSDTYTVAGRGDGGTNTDGVIGLFLDRA